jgi:hypothetical protein
MPGGTGTAQMFFTGAPSEETGATIPSLIGMLPGDHAEAWFQSGDSTASNGTDEHEEAVALCPLSCFPTADQLLVKAHVRAGLMTGFLMFHYAWRSA